jgi:hypothetical protein
MSLPFRVLTAVLLCLPTVVAADSTPSSTIDVRGAGSGPEEADAKRVALENALSQALEIVLDAATRTKQRAIIAEKILPKAVELLKDHEVIKTEKIMDAKVSVRLKASVERAMLLSKLVEAGVLTKEDVATTELGEKLVQFCKDNRGKKVGDGECGSLAVEAMKAAGAKPFHEFKENPGERDFVWGKLVFVIEVVDGKRKREPADARARPGDVIQYRDTTFRSTQGVYLFAHHTSVVAEAKSTGELVLYEQNMRGKKEVTQRTMRPSELSGGWIRVYRPVVK